MKKRKTLPVETGGLLAAESWRILVWASRPWCRWRRPIACIAPPGHRTISTARNHANSK